MKEFILGRNPVFETLRARRRHIARLLVAGGAEEKGRLADSIQIAIERKLPVLRVQRAQLDELGEGHQGVALEVGSYPYASVKDILAFVRKREEPLFLLALDMIQNPQNLGTLLRTAEAAGVHGVVIPLARAAEVSPAVVHASAGASEHLLIAQANLAQALEQVKEEANAWVVGLDGGKDSQPYDQVRLEGALALVVGNEGEGMRPLVRKSCDILASLPMKGNVESLNAAVAGSIVLYRAMALRKGK